MVGLDRPLTLDGILFCVWFVCILKNNSHSLKALNADFNVCFKNLTCSYFELKAFVIFRNKNLKLKINNLDLKLQ